jgi:hypothetical protein
MHFDDCSKVWHRLRHLSVGLLQCFRRIPHRPVQNMPVKVAGQSDLRRVVGPKFLTPVIRAAGGWPTRKFLTPLLPNLRSNASLTCPQNPPPPQGQGEE